MSTRTPWVEKARYPDLFFRLLDPALLVDPRTHQILDANDSAEHALGAPKEELLNASLTDWVKPEEQESFAQQLRIAMRRYHARDTEFHLSTLKKGGEFRLYRCALCQLQTGEGEIIVQIVATDITEERLAQETLKRLNERLEALSTTDELTQLANFRTLKDRLAEEHQRATRFHRSYSILFFDIDHFKQYNDRNGHQAGDEALREFAKLLKKQSRETDLVARYGGEEFVVLASETPHSGCMTFAERVRAAVAIHPFAHAKDQPLGLVSVSIGVATYPEHGSTPESVLKAADQAVYASKRAGRNRVTSAS